MIIKQMTRKSPGAFSQLVKYIASDKGRGTDWVGGVYHNLRSHDTKKVVQEFSENHLYKSGRKNGIAAYHIVLSFHQKDSHALTAQKCEDLATRYIELHAPNGLWFGRVHTHEGHPHIHLMLSSNEVCSPASTRISRSRFIQIRKDLEAYQRAMYPELKHSLVYTDKELDRSKPGRSKRKDAEVQLRKKGKVLDKDRLSGSIRQVLSESRTLKGFLQGLEKRGHEFYFYRDKVAGIMVEGKKYRFRTLGIHKDELLVLSLSREQSPARGRNTLQHSR